MFSSDLEYSGLALDAVEDARVVNRDVLLCDSFDNLLRDYTACQSANVVQLSATSSDAVNGLVQSFYGCREVFS